MGTYDATFDATNIPPQQAGGKHHIGNKFPFTITNTDVKDNKDAATGKHFEVEFTSPGGTITSRYNLWNNSAQAVEIAAKQLSALCHATGIFQINMRDGGKALRGGKGLMDVGFQAGQEPTAEKPEGGYVEVKKIYDINGNEPGKSQGAAPAQQSGAWGNTGGAQQQPQSTQQQPQVQQGWNNPAPNPAQQQPAPNSAAGWSQGGAAEKPPWQT